MSKLTLEREKLARANRNIASGERRIAAQKLLLARLSEKGCETGGAETLLLNLRHTLETWKVHRDEILREIARLEGTQSRQTEADPTSRC